MEIQEIKTRLTLAEVLNHYNLKPDKHLRLNCPFHNDKTPSLQVYYKTHTCYCFSSNCKTNGKSLDVIDFIMHKESLTKREAILKAKELIGGTASPVQQLTRTAILTRMFTYFKNAVHNSKPAREYLESRNLDHTKLEIGYNSGQFHHGSRRDQYLIDSCLKVGLLLDKGLTGRTGAKAYVPFGKGGIVFPLKNKDGKVISLYFRKTDPADGRSRHFYLKDRQGLYPHYPKPETQKLILTESIIDAASLLQNGQITKDYAILALYGTNGLTDEHFKAIKDLDKLEEVIFFLNGDEPGRKSASKYSQVIKNELPNLQVTGIEPPEGEDVNSLLQGHEPELLVHLITERKPLPTGQAGFSSSTEIAPQGIASAITNTAENKQARELNEIPSVERKKEPEHEPEPETPAQEKPKKKSPLNTDNPQCIEYTGQTALYKIRGANRTQPDSLKVSLQILHGDEPHRDHRSKLDLYEYKQVHAVSKQAAARLELDTEALEKELTHLTGLVESWRDEYIAGKQNGRSGARPKVRVPEGLVQKCVSFLKQKGLLWEIGKLIGKAGIVGEEMNRLLLFIIASSYQAKEPLHGLIQGSSGSGKTRLLKIICELMPTEDVKKYTRVTDGSFYNQDEHFFSNKLLGFEDIDGLKEEALLAVRELQSNGILITGTSFKDESGQIRGAEKVVKGPIASLACTTKGDLYEDNQSRVFMVAVDEGEKQTQQIISYQNQKAAGMIDSRQEQQTREFFQHVIRLLKPLEVVNPYANKIQLPQKAHKIRRLNELFQSIIKQITVIHQYQRKKDKENRLISEKEDVSLAIGIMFESIVLKVDELDGSLRQFFEKLKAYVEKKGRESAKGRTGYEFSRFEVREATGVSKTQQHHYISKLVEMEYLQQSGYANRGYKYKISYWDNMAAIRAKIKDELERQLQSL